MSTFYCTNIVIIDINFKGIEDGQYRESLRACFGEYYNDKS